MVNPEQSAPFVKLVPPYTYGFPTNCFAYSITEEQSEAAFVLDDFVFLEEEVVVDKEVSEHDICFKLDVKYKGLYNYGDSYSCYVGDGKVRIFYLLEDGDSELSTGKTPNGKITLIMKNNLVENYNEEEITELTKDWINVDIPTKEQIEKSTKQDFLKLEENYIVSNGIDNTVMTKDGFNDTETNYGYRPVIVIEK